MAPIVTDSSTVHLLLHESYFTFLVVGTIGTSFLVLAVMCVCCCKKTQKAKGIVADSKANSSMNPSSPIDDRQKSTKLPADTPDTSSKQLSSPPMKAIPGSPGAPITPSPSSSKSISRSPVANSPSMKLKQLAKQPWATATSVRPTVKQTKAEATSKQKPFPKAITVRAPYKRTATEEQAGDRTMDQQAKNMDEAPPPVKTTTTMLQSLNMLTAREKIDDGNADLQSKYHQAAVTCIDVRGVAPSQSQMPPVAPSIRNNRPPTAESMKQSVMVPKKGKFQTPVDARTVSIYGNKTANKAPINPEEVKRKRKGPTEKVIRVINLSTRETLYSRY